VRATVDALLASVLVRSSILISTQNSCEVCRTPRGLLEIHDEYCSILIYIHSSFVLPTSLPNGVSGYGVITAPAPTAGSEDKVLPLLVRLPAVAIEVEADAAAVKMEEAVYHVSVQLFDFTILRRLTALVTVTIVVGPQRYNTATSHIGSCSASRDTAELQNLVVAVAEVPRSVARF
jgi:hypothetical protein